MNDVCCNLICLDHVPEKINSYLILSSLILSYLWPKRLESATATDETLTPNTPDCGLANETLSQIQSWFATWLTSHETMSETTQK